LGEGLGNKFLANIREADAIAQVVRGFADPDVIHVDGKVDAAGDIETINTELILADLETLDKARNRIEKEVKGKKVEPSVLVTVDEALAWLNTGKPLSVSSIDITDIKELGLLTAKPILYVFNVDESVLSDVAKRKLLADLVAPAEADSAKWRRVFSKQTLIEALRVPDRPSSRASLVSDHLSFNSCDIYVSLKLF
jgi:ribosome-binding ATPase YchF (GTP1/OBG family)